MCGCNKAALRTEPLRAGEEDITKWRVRYASGRLRHYLSESEARVAAATEDGSQLFAPGPSA